MSYEIAWIKWSPQRFTVKTTQEMSKRLTEASKLNHALSEELESIKLKKINTPKGVMIQFF